MDVLLAPSHDELLGVLDGRMATGRRYCEPIWQMQRNCWLRWLGRSYEGGLDWGGRVWLDKAQARPDLLAPFNLIYPIAEHKFADITVDRPNLQYEGLSPSDDVWAPLVQLDCIDYGLNVQKPTYDEVWLRWAHWASLMGTSVVWTGPDLLKGFSGFHARLGSSMGFVIDPMVQDRALTGSRYCCEQLPIGLEWALALWPKEKDSLEKGSYLSLPQTADAGALPAPTVKDLGGGQYETPLPPQSGTADGSPFGVVGDERRILLQLWMILDGSRDKDGNPRYPYGRFIIRSGNALLYDAPWLDPYNPWTVMSWRSVPGLPYGLGEVMPLEAAQRQANYAAIARARHAATFPHPAMIVATRAKLWMEGRRPKFFREPIYVPEPSSDVMLHNPPELSPAISALIGEAVEHGQFIAGAPNAALGISPVSERLSAPALNSLTGAAEIRSNPIQQELDFASADLANKFMYGVMRHGQPRYVKLSDANPQLAQTLQQLGGRLGVNPESLADQFIWVEYQGVPRVRVTVRPHRPPTPAEREVQQVAMMLIQTGQIPPELVLRMLTDVFKFPMRQQLLTMVEEAKQAAAQQQTQAMEMEHQQEMEKLQAKNAVTLEKSKMGLQGQLAQVAASAAEKDAEIEMRRKELRAQRRQMNRDKGPGSSGANSAGSSPKKAGS